MKRMLRAFGRGLRWVRRWLLRLGLVLALLLAALAAPPAYTELMCRPSGSAAAQPAAQPGAISGAARYPAQYMAEVQDDYARVIAAKDPHDFGYVAAVAGYWQGLCQLNLTLADRGGFSTDLRTGQYLRGAAFTGYWLLKGAYEESAGRLVTMLRGKARAPMDQMEAAQAAALAASLMANPDQPYDAAADRDALRSQSADGLRDTERRLALRGLDRLRGWLDRMTARAETAPLQEAPPLLSLVSGVSEDWLAQQPGIRVIAAEPGGVRIETAGGTAFTPAAQQIALAGGAFVSIDGAGQILLSLRSPGPESGMLLSFPRQGAGDWRHLAEVPVTGLAGAIRALRAGPRELGQIFAP